MMRLKHYSLRTERTYSDWIMRFIRFHRMRHPAEMREVEMSEFLTPLARSENVSACDAEPTWHRCEESPG